MNRNFEHRYIFYIYIYIDISNASLLLRSPGCWLARKHKVIRVGVARDTR